MSEFRSSEQDVYAGWVDAILWVARHYRLDCSKENIQLTSRWMHDEALSTVLRNMARQVGLAVQVVDLSKSTLTNWRLPLVVQFSDGQIAVIESVSDGEVQLIYSGDEGLKNRIDLKVLLEQSRFAIAMRPSHRIPDSRIDEYIRPYESHWFRKIVLKDWKPYLHVFIATFIFNILALAGILFTRQVYDRVIPAESYPTLYVLFIGVLVAIIFGFILKKIGSTVTDLVGKRADLRISDKVFGHALRIKNTLRPRSTGVFIAQIRELDSVRELLTSTTIMSFADTPFFLLFCVVFYYIGGALVLVPIVAVILMLLPGLLAQSKLRQYANDAMRESSLRNAMLVEAMQGSEDIKTLQAEQRFQTQWNNYTAVTAESNLRLRKLVSSLTIWSHTVQGSVFVFIVLFGAPLVIKGELSTGSLIAASILGPRMVSPMAAITQVLNRWQQAKIALAGVDKLVALPVDTPEGERKVHLPHIRGSYEFDRCEFFYHEEAEIPSLVIRDLKINPGERVAILGRNGAGKSTLLQALSGLLEPKNGSVHLDGISIPRLDPADVRRDIGLVSQNSGLFHGTLRENLLMGAPMATDEAILQVLAMVSAKDFIRSLPNGLDYLIAEGGIGLSGGQRQAVLLARLLLRDPNVLLLDEPTASLDDVTEAQFIRTLSDWLGSRTLIISTHKMSLLNLVDRVIVVDKGRIVKDGTKEEVLASVSGKGAVRMRKVSVPPKTEASAS